MIRTHNKSKSLREVQEIMAHVEFFRKSGKPTVAYVERGSEKEYMVASTCEEVYVPPLGLLLLFGYCVQGLYVRSTLDKLGMEPTVRTPSCMCADEESYAAVVLRCISQLAADSGWFALHQKGRCTLLSALDALMSSCAQQQLCALPHSRLMLPYREASMYQTLGECESQPHTRIVRENVVGYMQVKRLGKYKTGNLLLRKDMGEEDREVYTSLLDGIHSHFVSTVAKVPHVIHARSYSHAFFLYENLKCCRVGLLLCSRDKCARILCELCSLYA
jgi:Peptidase family S49